MSRSGRNAQRILWCIAIAIVTVPLSQALSPQKIIVDGSTGVAPLMRALGEAFAARSQIGVEIGNGLGTKARLEALAQRKIDIAMASHGLKVADVTQRGMTVYPIAKSAVVFAVHESAKAAELSSAQVCAIYEGKYRNWKELRGSDLAIVAHIRPDSEVDTEVIRGGVACLKSMKFADAVKVMPRAGDMARALAETPGAFGVTSATVVEQSKGRVKAVVLDGAVADEANILGGRYRLTRDAFLVTRNDASAAVKAFIDFIKSQEGAAVIRANWAIAAK